MVHEPRIRGYSEQLSSSQLNLERADSPDKLSTISESQEVTNKKSQDEIENGVIRRQKLLMLSQAVVMRIRELGLKERQQMTGTQITNDILKKFNYFQTTSGNLDKESTFKNIQRRVYDTINVLDALNVITKTKNIITYNPDNTYFKSCDQELS